LGCDNDWRSLAAAVKSGNYRLAQMKTKIDKVIASGLKTLAKQASAAQL
jgi:hypothetical protein